MSTHLPSVTALESNDDDRIAAELRLARLRSQLAVVRTVADHVEQFSGAADADGLGQQLVEEIARLAARVLEAASGLTAASHAMMNPHVRHC
jgi:type II secretory pathway component PulM